VIGQLLDKRYRIVKVLGAGAFGKTYLAADTRRPGLPKCVVKELCPIANGSKSMQTAHRLFRREAETLEKLGRHDRIPRLLAYFQDSHQFYLVKEFVPGRSLATEIVPHKPLSETYIVDVLREVLEILQFVHRCNVIHRDIKPANLIRRQEDSKLVLIDFGSVKEISHHLVGGQLPHTVTAGTPVYMPVEQFQGNPQPNSDIYAVGMMAVQGLTGIPHDQLPGLRDPNTGKLCWRDRARLSDRLADIIDKMVCYYHGQRYQSVEEALADLNRFDVPSANSPTLPSNETPARSRRVWLRRPFILGLGGGILAILLALGWLWLRPSGDRAEQQYQQGIEQLERGNLDAAISHLDRAIRLDSDNAQAYHERGNAYFDAGNYSAAINDYTDAIQRGNNPIDSYFNRGLARLESGDRRGAIQDFTEVLQLDPDETEAYYKRGLAHYEAGDYRLAIEDYTQVIRQRDNAIDTYYNRGLAYSASGKKQKAIADFTQAIQLDDQHVDAYYSRGRARFALGDYAGAEQDYTRTIQLDSDYTDAYANRCSVRINLDKYEVAVTDCTKAIQLAPKDWVAYNNRCIARYNLEQYEKAIADCTQAIEFNSKFAKAYNNRALARMAVEDYEGAIADYSKAIQIEPNDAVAYNNRAAAYVELGNLAKAMEDRTQAIRLDPDYAAAYYSRGLVRKQLEDRQGAIEDFQSAAKLCLDRGSVGCYKDAQYQIQQLKN
jgi:serine/threonine protein kinase